MFAFNTKTSARLPHPRALSSLDVAVEFATLGEYRVVQQTIPVQPAEPDFCWTEPVTLASFRARGCISDINPRRDRVTVRA